MNEYLCGLVAISALVGVCSYISYGEGQAQIMKTVSSLILISVVISVPVGFIGNALDSALDCGDFWDSDVEIGDTQFGESAEKAFSDGTKKFICEKFSLSEEDVEIVIFDFNVNTMNAKKIKVILSGRAVLADNRAIAALVLDSGLGECEVELNVG